MKKEHSNHIKLGVFVMAGLFFLILLLYVIGKNQNLFGNTFQLKAHFENVQGLRSGNNVRYAGIDIGTVRRIEVLNDSTIEVVMLIRTGMKQYIRKNAEAFISTDGLMGNKLLNIRSVKSPGAVIEEGDVIASVPSREMDEMLDVLHGASLDVATIAGQLKQTVTRINQSQVLWTLLDDKSLPQYVHTSLGNIRNASLRMNAMMADLEQMVEGVKEGQGSIGMLIRDSAMAVELRTALYRIRMAAVGMDSLAGKLNAFAGMVISEFQDGDGAVQALLNDGRMKENLRETLANIEQGTRDFSENMEALKSSFLFRGYFRKKERQNKK